MDPKDLPTSEPAFPFVEPSTECSVSTGMTLRDYFAAKALLVVASGSHLMDQDFLHSDQFASAAFDAYRLADAMLKARESARVRDEAWQPIETAPNAEQRDMFVVRAFNVCNGFTGGRNYTSDAYCVWRDIHGGFARWPHHFAPTHWIPLPAPPVGTPKSAEGGGA